MGEKLGGWWLSSYTHIDPARNTPSPPPLVLRNPLIRLKPAVFFFSCKPPSRHEIGMPLRCRGVDKSRWRAGQFQDGRPAISNVRRRDCQVTKGKDAPRCKPHQTQGQSHSRLVSRERQYQPIPVIRARLQVCRLSTRLSIDVFPVSILTFQCPSQGAVGRRSKSHAGGG